MKYRSETNDFEKALYIDKQAEKRLKDAIKKAYSQNWHAEGANIDQINAFMAPYIRSQEEAFYVATIIVTDVVGAINESALKNPNVN